MDVKQKHKIKLMQNYIYFFKDEIFRPNGQSLGFVVLSKSFTKVYKFFKSERVDLVLGPVPGLTIIPDPSQSRLVSSESDRFMIHEVQ